MQHFDRPTEDPAVKKDNSKRVDFTDSIYKELQSSFDIEEQVEILRTLYEKLHCFYAESEAKALQEANINKEKLNLLRRLLPQD